MPPAEVHWCSLKPGDVVELEWLDHCEWRTPPRNYTTPLTQRTTARVKEVCKAGVVLLFDEHVPFDEEEWSGSLILGCCIVKALVWGSDGT